MNIYTSARPNTSENAGVYLLSQGILKLVVILVIGLLAPFFIRGGSFLEFIEMFIALNATLLSSTFAILLGFLLFRKMGSMPGLRETASVIPAFCLSYGLVATAHFGLRFDLSRISFFLSFIFVISSMIIISFILSKLYRPKIGLVIGGRADILSANQDINWVRLPDIETAKLNPYLAITVDLRSDTLSSEWEHYLAEEVVQGRFIYNAKQLNESLTGKVQLESLSENYMGHLAPDSIYAPTKRYFEFLFALIALILCSPIMVLTVVAIRLESKGSSLFKQKRMGYRGKPFTVYKFRSMAAREESFETIKADMTTENDARVTNVGRFIRKTRLDELPQLINVILGQMSLVGPRPETMNLSKWYETEIPFYRYRHVVRPGITGWAQVKQGHVTSVDDVREKLGYDLFYIKNFSIWLDIVIIFKTIKVFFTGNGAK